MARLPLSVAVFACTAAMAAAQDIELPPYPEKGLKGTVLIKRLPEPDHPVLQMGAQIWAKNCIVCHGTGNFGAPKITGSKFWKPRIAQGIDVLFEHAINGFISPSGGNMPARGGKDLTDDEVMAAVRFMISVSGGADEALSGLTSEQTKEN